MNKSRLLALTAGLGLLFGCKAPRVDHVFEELPGAEGPQVQVVTSAGEFVLRLNEELAPITVANFLLYVDEGFYDGDDGIGGTVFHRVIAGFMVQGGGFMLDGTEKQTHDPIPLESDNGLNNWRRSIAMARTDAPLSATSQFFINTEDNPFLNYGVQGDGYAVFGFVESGMDVVDTIVGGQTTGSDQPVEAILIEDMERL